MECFTRHTRIIFSNNPSRQASQLAVMYAWHLASGGHLEPDPGYAHFYPAAGPEEPSAAHEGPASGSTEAVEAQQQQLDIQQQRAAQLFQPGMQLQPQLPAHEHAGGSCAAAYYPDSGDDQQQLHAAGDVTPAGHRHCSTSHGPSACRRQTVNGASRFTARRIFPCRPSAAPATRHPAAVTDAPCPSTRSRHPPAFKGAGSPWAERLYLHPLADAAPAVGLQAAAISAAYAEPGAGAAHV